MTAVADEGYEFHHWSGNLSGSENPTTITMDSVKEVIANFTLITSTLTVNVGPDGSGTVTLEPSQPPGGYVVGAMVNLTAIADEGYEFDHWSGNLSGSENPTTMTMDSDKEVTAIFTEVTSSTFPWKWIVLGVIVVAGLVVLITIIKRRT